MNCILWHVAACATALMLCPTSSGAQTPTTKTPVTSFDELRGVLRDGDEVVVTNSDGRRTRGKVVTLTPSSLDLVVETRRFLRPRQRSQQSVADTAVTTVTRIDSRRNGALIGFAAGFLPLTIAGCAWDPDWCALYVILAAPPGAVGMVIGAFIDGKLNATVYRAGTPAVGGATVSLSPLLTRRATGALLNVRF